MKVRVVEENLPEQFEGEEATKLVLRSVEATVEEARFLVRSTPLRLVVAFSGGEDSRVLLDILQKLSRDQNLELVIAHLNHGLRPESDEEAKFAQQLARKYRLPCHIGRVPSWDRNENLESWARRVRYEFLYRCLDTVQGHLIVTAHHMNDQAETVMQRFLSGRLASDARAIARLNIDRRIFRPPLHLEKKDLERYSQQQNLQFVVDRSNYDLKRSRNLIRHRVLPELSSAFNPKLVRTIAQFASRMRDDEEVLWQVAREEFARLDQERTITRVIDRLIELPAGIAWRVLSLRATAQLGAHTLGYRVFSSLRDRIVKHPPQSFRVDVGFGLVTAYQYQRGIEFLTESSADIVEYRIVPELLPVPGRVERNYQALGSSVVESRIFSNEPSELISFVQRAKLMEKAQDDYSVAFFDADKLPLDEIVIREREEGDEVRVFQRGRRKVKKLLQEAKIPSALRNALPFVVAQGRVLWIPGVCRSEAAPLTSQTKHVLELNYRRFALSNAYKS